MYFFRGFRDYLVSWLQDTGLEKHVLIKSYIRRFLAMGYGTINFIKFLKGSRETRARISNIKSKKKRRERRSHKHEKSTRKKERLSFPEPKK